MKNQLKLIRAALAADQPVLLWGAPGSGKTSAVEALAAAEGAVVETVIGSTLDPVDVSGMPTAGGWRLMPWAERVCDRAESRVRSWLFFDEISCAPPSVQAALLRVIWSRELGGRSIRGVRIVAAANPADSAADGGVLSGAMANRWLHVNWTTDATEWVSGELGGWGRGAVSAERARAAASVCGYIRRSPAALLAQPEKMEDLGRAWPSPRSWSGAIGLLAEVGGPRAEMARECVAAAVGDAAAAEWANWEAAQDLPDPEALLAGRAAIPERGDQAFAAVLALAACALSEHEERRGRVEAAWRILAGVRPDIALAGAKALRAGAPEVVTDEAVDLGKKISRLT